MKSLLWLIPFASLLLGCVSDSIDDSLDGESEVIHVGDRVPLLTVNVIDGNRSYTFSTSELFGETVIVFFNTGCSDCQRELPVLNAWYLKHRDDPGFQMVAIAREEQQESIAAYWGDHQLSLPYSPQADRSIYNLFATLTIPRVYFCSKEGIVTRIDIEKLDYSLYQ